MIHQLRLTLVTLFLFSQSACSVMMAMQGTDTPDLTALRVGSSRAEVEAELGFPIVTIDSPNGGVTNQYQYIVDDEPSPSRAMVYALADVVSLCLWEIVGSRVELDRGSKRILEVDYDAAGTVLEIRRVDYRRE